MHQPDPISDGKAYDALPESIKASLSPREWAWLTPEERRRYLDNETEPEHDQ